MANILIVEVTPFFACLFERHVIHVHTSDNLFHYISFPRRIQGTEYELLECRSATNYVLKTGSRKAPPVYAFRGQKAYGNQGFSAVVGRVGKSVTFFPVNGFFCVFEHEPNVNDQ